MRPLNPTPVDRVAARVTRQGFKYEPAKWVRTSDQPTPFATIKPTKAHTNNASFADLTGRRVGRLVVYGLTGFGSWACRCDCGTHTLRHAKSIKNPANAEIDRCEHCRHLAYLRRADEFRQTGRNKEWKP
jgi:hypothetical protein